MTRKQVVYLDMDGTIADLYGQAAWLQHLEQEDMGLFINCEPLVTEAMLYEYFPSKTYELRICSMTPKGASKAYCDIVIAEKNEWLDKYFPSIKHRVYLKYGHNKNLRNSANHILVDDNQAIRLSYKGLALSPMWL